MASEDRQLLRAVVEAVGYMELELPQKTVSRLQQVQDRGHDHLHWNVLMGEALRALERHADALPHLQRACELSPEQIDIYLSLGWCYKRTNRLSMAIRALETAHHLQPDSDLVLYNLACYHSLAGHKADCLNYLSRALQHSERWRDHVPTETDFDPYRADPDFQRLIQSGSVTDKSS